MLETECGVTGHKCPTCGHLDPTYIETKAPIDITTEYGQPVRINGKFVVVPLYGGFYVQC
jgi:hypothetical protein